MWKEERKWEIW